MGKKEHNSCKTKITFKKNPQHITIQIDVKEKRLSDDYLHGKHLQASHRGYRVSVPQWEDKIKNKCIQRTKLTVFNSERIRTRT